MITISGILAPATLQEIRALVATLGWRDGVETAGHAAKRVKHNMQADLSTRNGAKVKTLLENAIRDHPVVHAAAQPRRFARLVLSKTTAGGGYGLHVDNPFMRGPEGEVRTDVAFTLFLSDIADYEGGELVIEEAGMARTLKLPLGDMVLYPATNLHRVAPVIRGERLACVGWIESRIRDAADREILFDLENLRASLGEQQAPDSVAMLTLSKAIANLLRRFG